ncbi:MAG: DUF3520 domain-containing protein [Candidatus Zixiibacteriota bacterium]|nr:MAG: DUF3520 domain-containing protein [candidate division Zixibacteria bacterium]
MSTRTLITTVVVALLLAAVFGLADEQKVGRIEGQLFDRKTQAPIIGASVRIEGTRFGAVTERDGRFVIPNVKVGEYTLVVTHPAYQTLKIEHVVVKEDETTTVVDSLVPKTTELTKKITVTAKQDIIEKFEPSSQTSPPADATRHRPVQTVDNLLEEAAGVQTRPSRKLYIRGGRADEAEYILTGKRGGKPVVPVPLAHGGTTTVNGAAYSGMFFKHYGVNPFVDTEDDHLSTFAVDVDDASYVMTRSYLQDGNLPPEEAVRTEEFINHFTYRYAAPVEKPFNVFLEGAPAPFGGKHVWMLRVGIKGREIPRDHRKPANLVFCIDVSGSMSYGDRLELVKKALRLLLDELTPADRVGIVVYGSEARVVLRPTSIAERQTIQSAIDQLCTDGATNAEEGIRLAYDMADRMFDPRKINRIILCSDGVANVGTTGPDDILKQIKYYADKGITLSTVGFGMGNYNDELMEKLGDKGNGHYAYVDDLDEARRIFVDNLTGTLEVIARDVKIQVDFDPEVVRSYRLIGYENRDVPDKKFRDDNEDGGEIGSGHMVTALYELKLHERAFGRRLGTIFIRYKHPQTGAVAEIDEPIRPEVFRDSYGRASNDFRLAATAAEFAEILRGSYWAKGSSLSAVMSEANTLWQETRNPEVVELVDLILRAQRLRQERAEK